MPNIHELTPPKFIIFRASDGLPPFVQDRYWNKIKTAILNILTLGSFLKASPTFSYVGAKLLQWPHPKQKIPLV